MSIVGENAQNQQMAINKENEDGISVPNWLIDVLKWITRIEMANSSLSFSCRMFKLLCWPKLHDNVLPHPVPRLTFFHKQNAESFKISAKMCKSCVSWFDFLPEPEELNFIQIAKTKPPKYIAGFQQLHLCFLDGQILKFMQNVLLPFVEVITLGFRIRTRDWESDNIRIGPIRRLLEILAPKVFELCLSDFNVHLHDFNRLFPGFIQRFQYITLDSGETDWDLLMEWLGMERADGKPKMLKQFLFGGVEQRQAFAERVKQEFLHSKRPSPFIIDIGPVELEDLTLENAETGEMLAIYQNQDPDPDEDTMTQYIVRHAKGMELARLEWEKQFVWHERMTSVGVEIKEIGVF